MTKSWFNDLDSVDIARESSASCRSWISSVSAHCTNAVGSMGRLAFIATGWKTRSNLRLTFVGSAEMNFLRVSLLISHSASPDESVIKTSYERESTRYQAVRKFKPMENTWCPLPESDVGEPVS
jgi:hypothetical protein